MFTCKSPPEWSMPHSITKESPLGAVYVVALEAGHETEDELGVAEVDPEVEVPLVVEDPVDEVEDEDDDDDGSEATVPLRTYIDRRLPAPQYSEAFPAHGVEQSPALARMLLPAIELPQ